jgi:multidrug resistance efflux pump
MTAPAEQIPIPWSQRWELIRERLLPAACLAATLAVCGWLWRQQALVAPTAIGEVHADVVEIASPCNGELLPIESTTDGKWPLFAAVDRYAVVARIKDRDAGNQVVEMKAPLAGSIVAAPAMPGQFVRAGDLLVRVVSPTPDYIVCHLTGPEKNAPEVGALVSVRQRGHDARWHASRVEAVGPAVEPAPAYQSADALVPIRGLPVRIALPENVDLTPGSVVEVRFSPSAQRAL